MSNYEPQRDVEQLVSCCEYKNIDVLPHFHRCVELIYVLSGKVNAKIDDQSVSAIKDEIIFIPSGYTHSMQTKQGTISITLMIPYRYFAPFEKSKVYLRFICLKDKKFNKEIYQYILNIKNRVDYTPTLLLQGLVMVVLGLITERYAPQLPQVRKSDLILDIVNYIEQNYTEDISLEKISSHFGYSKYYFSKLFNKLFNCNLKSYVNMVRFNKVEADKEEGVAGAALKAGFGSLSSYYKFKRKNERKSLNKNTPN